MGDVMSLIEEAEQKIDKKKAKKLAQKITRGESLIWRLPGPDSADE